MKRLKSTAAAVEFQLEAWEGVMLATVLGQYPCVPAAHQPLSQGDQVPEAQASQQLLDEALAEHRQENRQQLEALLADTRRFRQSGTGWRLTLTRGDVEWVLQVLNDVRVGAWVKLGSPDNLDTIPDEGESPEAGLMETAGYFQAGLLAALRAPPGKGTRS